ncbi:PREDICTED: major facilitator superfamily domain-containing protein 6-like [Branchiostoma belcheri]|uniref:Major facilitator superfamily domain-containing protein 6-like n=1 Tax=Branchiostoma belcheri TaxID=7741 RepID=A0A6P4XY42_BRABE|nr:PREDICTED: major facilitator superfamily domain-containing protein 6-like [Branchiostoma belcheri]
MVDCKLLTLKLYYFLFFGGIACFVPYISVYLRQLGLLSYQAGIISGTYPFFTFLLKPILGAVADRFDRHKQTLMLCLFLTYCLMFSTMFVPPVKRGGLQISADCFSCKSWCGNSSTQNPRLQSPVLLYQAQGLCNCSKLQEDDSFVQTSSDKNLTERTLSSTSLQLRCSTKSGCFLCPCNTTESDCDVEVNHLDTETKLGWTFWILFFLLVPAQALQNASRPQADAHTMQLLKNNPSDFGKQRLWGAVGFGLASVIAGFAMDNFSERRQNQDETDYSVTFYMFAGFGTATLLTVAFGFEKWRQARPQKMFRSLQKLLRRPNELLFLVIMFIIGSSFGAKANFLFWYLKDIGGSQLLLGLALMISCMGELPFMFFSGKLIRKIGHQQVFQLALFCYAVKFLSYSLIPSPWWVLAIEPLHGITFGAMFSASVTYASLIAPPGMEATMQSIVSAFQFGVGYASGSLIGGAIFHAFGGVVLFRTYAVVCLVSCILYRLIPRCLTRSKDEVASQGPQRGDSAEEQGDPRTEISSKFYETILENADVPIYTETSV